ncbi:MAG: PUR family DNA/RNA-binding protein [Flavobacteriales bacterium]|nr:PUR family DNA/RNA-binding protein [Flavobacteriales bacterium]
MDGQDSKRREDIFSLPIRAGKRTYFFDVKATRGDDYYLTITESKRRVDDHGKFHYDKHKLFLYKEDFEKFIEGLNDAIKFIKGEKGEDYGSEPEEEEVSVSEIKEAPAPSANGDSYASDISFDDLDDDDR